MRKITLSEFIERARKVHGDKYDYSKVIYDGMFKKVKIVCPIHGEFEQNPHDHLSGKGCYDCGLTKNKGNAKYKARRLSHGVGINDYEYTTDSKDENYTVSNNLWNHIIERCFSKKWHEKRPTYIGCTVCEEWKVYSNFKKWFDDPNNGYKKGYEVDKDIIVKGNKLYSPETCCFVPPYINSFITNRKRFRGDLPLGVHRRPSGKFFASMSIYGKNKKLGDYFTIEEAFNAYKKAKESHIQEVAQEYFDKGLITKRVYDALMNYKIEITD